MKYRTEILVERLKLSEVLEKLWIYLTVNFITKLPFKITHFVATIEEILAEELARLFQDNI